MGAIIDQPTGCQAQLARHFGNQEAAAKRLSQLLHNERLEPQPRHLADTVLLQALGQLPTHGPIWLAIDWRSEGPNICWWYRSWWRAVPIYWRAYEASVLKGRMKRYEHALIRRAVTRVLRKAGRHRMRVTSDRDFADVALFTLEIEHWYGSDTREVELYTEICVWYKCEF